MLVCQGFQVWYWCTCVRYSEVRMLVLQIYKEQRIIWQIHKFKSKKNHLNFIGCIKCTCWNTQTHTQIHRLTTVCLAAHARWGKINGLTFSSAFPSMFIALMLTLLLSLFCRMWYNNIMMQFFTRMGGNSQPCVYTEIVLSSNAWRWCLVVVSP